MTTRETPGEPPDTTAAPRVSIVIPSYGCAATIGHVLEALFNQTVSPLEIVVVNDCSPDNLEGALQPYMDRITYIRNERNMGLAKTYNNGLRHSTAPFVMTLHSDCILDPDYVEKLLTHLESDPSIGAACGQYLIDNVKDLAMSDRMFIALNRIPVEKDRADQLVSAINFIEGKADMFRRDVISQYNFFDENLILTAEDQDLSAKLLRDGYRLIQDAGCRFRVMFTETSSSLWKVLRKQRTYARGQVYVSLKFPRNVLAPTTTNRQQRAFHRLFQLGWACLFVVLSIAGFVWPISWLIAALMVLLRMMVYAEISKPLGTMDRLLAAILGPLADLLYTAGAIEGLIKTVLFKKT